MVLVDLAAEDSERLSLQQHCLLLKAGVQLQGTALHVCNTEQSSATPETLLGFGAQSNPCVLKSSTLENSLGVTDCEFVL